MRVRFHPCLALYLASMALFSSWRSVFCAAFALLVHEAGHAAAGLLFKEPIAEIELTPFGGVMTYAPGAIPSKGLRGAFLSAAGPLGNELGMLGAAAAHRLLGTEWTQNLMLANLTMLLLNLLPVLPLDGGNLIFSIGYYFFHAAKLIRFLSVCGVAAGLGLWLLAFYGLAKLGIINCSLLIIGGYMMICAVKSRNMMLAQNVYAVVQERQAEMPEGVRRIQPFSVAPETRVQALLAPMARVPCAAFVIKAAGETHILSEQEVCRMLLAHPSLTIEEAIAIEHEKPEKILLYP